MYKNSSILVTGHTGFVGGVLLKKLKDDGYTNVHTFDRKEIDLLHQHNTMGAISYGFDFVFVCSAVVGGIKANMDNPYKFLHDNLVMQNNIINACVKTGVKKVLFLGSSCIYPKDYKQPLKEEYLLEAPLEPTNEGYALAKIAGLKLCEYANKEFDTDFVSLMPCNLYGEGDHYDLETSHVLSALVKKICDAHRDGVKEVEVWGSGNQSREFLYIDDLIDGMIWSMNNVKSSETFLNIGTGEDLSIRKLAYLIKYLVGYDGEFKFNTEKPDGMMKKCLDVSRINNLGWKAKIEIETGLVKTIEEYKKSHQVG